MLTQRQWFHQREGDARLVRVTTLVRALCCGVMLFGAVSAHAASINGLGPNGLTTNGWAKGLAPYDLRTTEEGPVEGPREGLPMTVISQRALGKTQM